MRDLTKEHQPVRGGGRPAFASSLIRLATACAVLFSVTATIAGAVGAAETAAPGLTPNITPAQRAQAVQTAQQGIPVADLAPSAPSQYQVRKGDTLWGISGRFLRQPWRWPELWGMNRLQVRNPHLIYPGQVLYLNQRDGRAWLSTTPVSLAGTGAGDTVRLSPGVRMSDGDANAIPSIPAGDIEPFLIRPLVVDDGALQTAARIVALPESRVYLARGERAFVRGIGVGLVGSDWQAYKPARPVSDPVTGKVLGYEAEYQGNVRIVGGPEGPDGVSTAVVTQAQQEMGPGTLLMPLPAREPVRYVPRAPEVPVDGRVAAVYGGVNYGGAKQAVVLNIGTNAGLEPGDVVELSRTGGVARDITEGNQPIVLPDERYGLAFVFRVFTGVAYALVTDASNTVEVGDHVLSPR